MKQSQQDELDQTMMLIFGWPMYDYMEKHMRLFGS